MLVTLVAVIAVLLVVGLYNADPFGPAKVAFPAGGAKRQAKLRGVKLVVVNGGGRCISHADGSPVIFHRAWR